MFLSVTYSLLVIVPALSFALFARSVEDGSAALLNATPAANKQLTKQRIVSRDIVSLESMPKRYRL